MKFDGCCAFCGDVLPAQGWHAECIDTECVPGGLVPVCTECSTSKGEVSLDEFRALLSQQVDRAHRNSSNFRTALRFGLVSKTGVPVKFWFEKQATKRTFSSACTPPDRYHCGPAS
nr:HNH endonuclease [Rahnella sp. BCC 1045]